MALTPPQCRQSALLRSQISRLQRLAYHYQRLSELHLEEAAELVAINDAGHTAYIEQETVAEALVATVND